MPAPVAPMVTVSSTVSGSSQKISTYTTRPRIETVK